MRSLLFVPGDSEHKLEKALAAGADAVIADLEDSVTTERKAAARAITRAFLDKAMAREARPRIYVRVNPVASKIWNEDLDAVMGALPDGIMLPKPRSGTDVRLLSTSLDRMEPAAASRSRSKKAQTQVARTRILALPTEEPGSLLQLMTYVSSSPRLEGLAWGAEDLSAAMGASATRDGEGVLSSPFRLARDLCLVTAAAAGCLAIDGVWRDLADGKGLEREAAEAARDGFAGKLAVHPDQVPVINAAFTPSNADVERAQAIVAAFAQSPDAGVIAFEGQMLDRPHLARAERVLARARAARPS